MAWPGQRLRLTGITYPNGNAVTLAYGGVISNGINRPDALVESGVTLASYRFMGLGTQVGLKYDAASATELTYQIGSTGDAGDQYTGIDRFGRLVKTLWQTGTTAKVQSSYGRNRAGGVVWRKDLVAPSTANQDTYDNYDGLQQVSQYQRGLLTGPTDAYTGITAAASEAFVYDQTGNWNSFTRTPGPLLQTRSQNKANEITGIADTVGIPVPTYDAVGNMTLTSVPSRPSTTAFPCQWDAWNRLVKVGSTSSPVANYEYDGMSRRTESVLPTISASQSFYYDRTWRMIEEHKGGAVQTYLWSPFDRWTLLRRLKAVAGSPDEKRWCLKDGLDPAAVIDSTGTVLGRLGYDAFGNTSYMSDTFGTTSFGPADWNFAFHGEFMDVETGLYNYGYRYYHAELGRWLSRDPIGEIDGYNLYRSFGNNPEGKLDVLGKAVASYSIPGRDFDDNANELPAFEAAQIDVSLVYDYNTACGSSDDCSSSSINWEVTVSVRLKTNDTEQLKQMGLLPGTFEAGDLISNMSDSFYGSGGSSGVQPFRAVPPPAGTGYISPQQIPIYSTVSVGSTPCCGGSISGTVNITGGDGSDPSRTQYTIEYEATIEKCGKITKNRASMKQGVAAPGHQGAGNPITPSTHPYPPKNRGR